MVGWAGLEYTNFFRPRATLCLYLYLAGHSSVKKAKKIGLRGPYVAPSDFEDWFVFFLYVPLLLS